MSDNNSLGKYSLREELGRGGVGRVLLGHDEELDREVAIKFLLDRHATDPKVVRRFVDEARIGGRLQHPGVVPVYELNDKGGKPYFAMKLVQGETLASLLERRSDPTEERQRFLSIFEDVCQTVAYAHARSVVHRDLKPDNVMIGAFGEVQVVDWGLGKVLGEKAEPDPVTPADARTMDAHGEEADDEDANEEDGDERSDTESIMGTAIGTPSYMPPEQALGNIAAMDERSDVFGLGAILCEILTGEPPYERESPDLLVFAATARLEDARERLSKCGAEQPLIDLANACLRADPGQRPENASVVARSIHDHLTATAQRLEDARIAQAKAEVRARALRRTQLLGLALLIVIAGGLATSLWFWRRAEDSAQNERIAGQGLKRELERSEEIRRLVRQMLEGVTPAEARAQDTALLEDILERTANHLDAQHGLDPLVAAELHHLVGSVFQSIGRYERALQHLDDALDLRSSELGHDHPDTLNSLMVKSEALSRTFQSEESAAAHDELIDRLTSSFGQDDPAP